MNLYFETGYWHFQHHVTCDIHCIHFVKKRNVNIEYWILQNFKLFHMEEKMLVYCWAFSLTIWGWIHANTLLSILIQFFEYFLKIVVENFTFSYVVILFKVRGFGPLYWLINVNLSYLWVSIYQRAKLLFMDDNVNTVNSSLYGCCNII